MNPKTTPEQILEFNEAHRLPEHYRLTGRTRRAFLTALEWMREDVLATEGQRPDPAQAGALANVLGDVINDVYLNASQEWEAQGRPPEPHPYHVTGVHIEPDDGEPGAWTTPPTTAVADASAREPREAPSTPAEPKDAPSASDEPKPSAAEPEADAVDTETKGGAR